MLDKAKEKKVSRKAKRIHFLNNSSISENNHNQTMTWLYIIYIYGTCKFTINFKQTFLQNKFLNIIDEVYLSRI